MQAGVGDVAQPDFELQIEVVEIVEDATEEEILADVPERPLDLALGLRPIGAAGLGQEAVMMRQVAERTVVDDLPVGILADYRGFHTIIQDLARHAAERFEGRLVAREHRLHRLAMGKASPDQTRVAKDHREQPDDMHDARLRCEADAELGEVDLGLLSRQGLEANGKPLAATSRAQRANLVAHHAVATCVTASCDFTVQALRRQPRILTEPRPQIRDVYVYDTRPWLPRTIARRLQAPRDVFANRFTVDPRLPSDSGNLQPLPV
jgi:hypothetical protein